MHFHLSPQKKTSSNSLCHTEKFTLTPLHWLTTLPATWPLYTQSRRVRNRQYLSVYLTTQVNLGLFQLMKDKMENRIGNGNRYNCFGVDVREKTWRRGYVYTWDNTEAWCARSRANLSDLGVIRGAANPWAALQLLQTFFLFQVWGFCKCKKIYQHSFWEKKLYC